MEDEDPGDCQEAAGAHGSMLEISHPCVSAHLPQLATTARLPNQQNWVGESNCCDCHCVSVPEIPRPERRHMRAVIFQRFLETPHVDDASGPLHPGDIVVVKGCQAQELLWRKVNNQLLAVNQERSRVFPGKEMKSIPRVVHDTFLTQETLQARI